VASLNALIAHAEATRRETVRIREETRRLSRQSADAARDLAISQQICQDWCDVIALTRDEGPRWPAWGAPNEAELRLTLVPVD